MPSTAENEWWDKSAAARFFYRSREHQQAQFELVAKFLPRGGKRRLLDVGCGYGDFIPWLPSGYIYEGIDANPDAIESARMLYPGYHFRCTTKIVNANVIIAVAAIQHMIVPAQEFVDDMLAHCKLLIVTTVNEKKTPGDWDFAMRDLFPDGTEVVNTEDDFMVLVTEGLL